MASRLVVQLGRRFMFSKGSGSFLSFISWVSILGVTLGVLALVVVTSVINGFEGELSRAVTGLNGEVILYSRGNAIPYPEEVESKIKEIVPEVSDITRSFVMEMMVAGRKGVAGSVLEGIDSETLGSVTEVPKRVLEGEIPGTGKSAALGSHLAEKIGAKVGDEIRLILPFVGEQGESRVFKVKVAGIFKMGMYRYDSKFLLVPLTLAQELLQEPGKVTTFKMKLKKGVDLEEAARKLSDQFGYPFKAKYWGQLDRNLLYAIKLEKIVIAIILTAILVIAAFNVVSTLMMMIYDKTKELSILKAMGFLPGQSFRLFCGMGLVIGTAGTFLGVLLGLGLNRLIENSRLVRLPEDIYHIGYLPVVERWWEIGMVVGVALLISLLATIYPAYRVMRQSPLEGLRYE